MTGSSANFDHDLVSIVMPAWQAENYIADAIASVLEQSYHNWELFIVDDCSTDTTADIAMGFQRSDDRIHLVKQKINGGPAQARNAALTYARGRWVAFLDCDDLWHREKLEVQLKRQSAASAVISYSSFIRFNDYKIGRQIGVPPELDYHKLLGNTAIATSTVIVDREISGLFLMKETYYDDLACWLELLRGGQVAVGVDKPLMKYRVLPGSISRNKLKSAFEVWKIYRDIERLSVFHSIKHFASYSVRGFLKYLRF